MARRSQRRRSPRRRRVGRYRASELPQSEANLREALQHYRAFHYPVEIRTHVETIGRIMDGLSRLRSAAVTLRRKLQDVGAARTTLSTINDLIVSLGRFDAFRGIASIHAYEASLRRIEAHCHRVLLDFGALQEQVRDLEQEDAAIYQFMEGMRLEIDAVCDALKRALYGSS